MVKPLELILVSSIPGQNIRLCVDNIISESHGDAFAASDARSPDKVLCVEDFLIHAAAESLELYRPNVPLGGYTLADVLALPIPELTGACHSAFLQALRSIVETRSRLRTKANIAILTFHPVLYHQVTREFVTPYLAVSLADCLKKLRFGLSFVVSIHEDIYEVYRHLLASGKLFTPTLPRSRDPIRDLHEERLLLDWRDRELAAAKSLAAGLKTRHFLFHQKGRRTSLWDIIGKKIRSTYFSHPISQPRRDLTGKSHPDKCKIPDIERGREFIKECEDFADKISRHIPIVEPTAIDELRLDAKQLENVRDIDLRAQILPPLSDRWPAGDSDHVGERVDSDVYDRPFMRVPQGTFERVTFSETPLATLTSALQMIEFEILRQIAVRDYTLAEQCDLVLAYRPFTLPDSPEPSGGVRKEMEVVQIKVGLGRATCKPALIVLHPLKDEISRRRKVFDQVWKDLVSRFFEDENSKLVFFGERGLQLILDEQYLPDLGAVSKKFRALIQELKLTARPINDDTSMSAEKFGRSEEAQKLFIEHLLRRTPIFESFLHVAARDTLKDYILLVDYESATSELCSTIARVVRAKTKTMNRQEKRLGDDNVRKKRRNPRAKQRRRRQ